MLRFYVPIAILGGVAALVACSGRDPVECEDSVRGWLAGSALLRPAYRLRGPPDGRYITLGFRIARALD